ncbi:hypothetical protein [Comamonas badia]|uniref:hypothetical protein n=1 Tax=Comamonas badia TaxID=265291 RepID=UPI001B7FE531|nr:hypothetical protein [Comamonas badia]
MGHQAALFDEPDEDQAREQANHANLIALGAAALGKVHLLAGPQVPPGELLVEALVELFGGQRGDPGVVQLTEVAGSALVAKVSQRKAGQDVDVRAVRAAQAHVLDDGDAAVNDVAAGVAQVCTPIDHGQRKQGTVPEQEDGRHGKALVQLAGDGGELGARPWLALQLNGKKDEGLHLALLQRAVCAQGRLVHGQRGDFVVAELEQEGAGFPAAGLYLGAVNGARFGAELLDAG